MDVWDLPLLVVVVVVVAIINLNEPAIKEREIRKIHTGEKKIKIKIAKKETKSEKEKQRKKFGGFFLFFSFLFFCFVLFSWWGGAFFKPKKFATLQEGEIRQKIVSDVQNFILLHKKTFLSLAPKFALNPNLTFFFFLPTVFPNPALFNALHFLHYSLV